MSFMDTLIPEPKPQFAWTDEVTEQALSLWKIGVSASQIAVCIGCPSRSAVIGKMHRLGGKLSPDAVATRRAWNVSDNPKKEKKPKKIKSIQQVNQTSFRFEPIPAAANWRGVELLDLTNNTCRFPSGDSPFSFCGDPTADLAGCRPYCPFHSKLAYREPNVWA